MTEPTPARRALGTAAGIGAAVGGWALSQYAGASAWVPGGAVLLFLLLFTKTPVRPRHFLGAIAVTAAHVAWFVVACLILGSWSAAGLDIVALSIGILWLWAWPGLGAALCLGIVQAASLVGNAASLVSAEFGSPEHRALTVHCLLRVLALACLVVGYLHLRRERRPDAPAVVVPVEVAGADVGVVTP